MLACLAAAAAFIAGLTDIIYEEEQGDVRKVQEKLAAKGKVLSDQNKRWRRARIRRSVRRGEKLEELIQELITKYTALICPVDGVSPVTDELRQVFKNASERSIKIEDSMKSPIDLLQGECNWNMHASSCLFVECFTCLLYCYYLLLYREIHLHNCHLCGTEQHCVGCRSPASE